MEIWDQTAKNYLFESSIIDRYTINTIIAISGAMYIFKSLKGHIWKNQDMDQTARN